MQIIGFCRFSYPAEGGFQVEHDDIATRIAYLYAPERIEARFRQFETICLPGIAAQTDPEFTFLVLVGEAMPAPLRARLEGLLAAVPQARIVARPPGPHRQVCQEVINDARDMDEPCVMFRHDDDDAVAVTFVERLRAAARDCAALTRSHRMVGFDWNRGWVGRPTAQGLRAEPTVTPYWGVAQAAAVQPGVRLTLMNFAHNRINRFMPTVTFTHEDMYLRGHNDHNDSRQKAHVAPAELPLLDAAGEAHFRERFAIDADRVRAVFASP